MNNLISQDVGEPFRGLGPLGLEGEEAWRGAVMFSAFMKSLLGILTVIAIIWFVLLLIMGAISIMTAGGDKNALEAARKKITNAIIGLVVLIAAIFILVFISYILGLDLTLILSPARFLETIWQ
jgi:hypothetical protein